MSSETYAALCRPKEEEYLVRAAIDGLLQGRDEAHHALLGVPPQAFTSFRAREVWEACLRLYRSGQVPDLPALEGELLAHGKIRSEQDWYAHYLSWLESGSFPGDESRLAGTVLSLHQRRELHKLYLAQAERVLNPLEDHLEVAQSGAGHSLQVVSGGPDEPLACGDAIVSLVERQHKFRENQEGAGKLAWFGIPILDGDPSDGGIPAAPGHVIIIAARPGTGKTVLAVQIAAATAAAGQEVLVASLELDRFEFWKRLAGHVTETPQGRYWHGGYTEFHAGRLRARKTELNRIRVWAPARPTWSRLEAKIRGAALRGVQVVVIDHFSEINLGSLTPRGGKRFEAAGECAQRIKALAKELGICIVVIAQLNREVPRGEMPGTEHLRETGELEQIAYSILALYRESPSSARPGVRDTGPDAPPPLEPQLRMAVLKNRDGKAGYSRRLSLDGACCILRDQEERA